MHTFLKKLAGFMIVGLTAVFFGCNQAANDPVAYSLPSEHQGKAHLAQFPMTASTISGWTFELTAGPIECAACSPTVPTCGCRFHEWRATFEAIGLDPLDPSGYNHLRESGWNVIFYDQKASSQPLPTSSSWIQLTGLVGDTWPKALVFIDGEWAGVSSSPPLWMKAHISNSSLNFSVDLIGRCSFSYEEISPNRMYNNPEDLTYGGGVIEMVAFTYVSPSVSISGPTTVVYPAKGKPSVEKTWSAVVTGGTSPFIYAWYRKVNSGTNTLVSPSSTYKRTYSFIGFNQYYTITLTLNVTDAVGLTTSKTLTVIEESADMVQFQ